MGCNCTKKVKTRKIITAEEEKVLREKVSQIDKAQNKKSRLKMLKTIWEESKNE